MQTRVRYRTPLGVILLLGLVIGGLGLLLGGSNQPPAVSAASPQASSGKSGKPAFAASAWSYTGSMHEARSGHTATLLPNGKVLVAGGYNVASSTSDVAPLASAEIYDPATGTWSYTTSMHQPHGNHSAILLPIGKVLVIDINNNGTSIESYDPQTAVWALVLTTNSYNGYGSTGSGSAILLPTGKILLVGTAASAVYDPISNSISAPTSLPYFSYDTLHTSLLPDGKVLVVGTAYNYRYYYLFYYTYNPANNSWSSTDTYSAIGASSFGLESLLDGKVLLIGGYLVAAGYYASETSETDLYNVATNGWTKAGYLPEGRFNPVSALLPDGRLLVTGGQKASNYPYLTADLTNPAITETALYNPSSTQWVKLASMNQPRTFHTETLLLDGRVLVTGGRDCDYKYINGGFPPPDYYNSAEVLSYAGDGTAAQSMTGLSVNQVSPQLVNQPLQLTAFVRTAIGTAGGTVTFKDNGVSLGSAALANAQATLSLPSLSEGTHNFTAEYSGNSVFQASTSLTITQVAQRVQTNLGLSVPATSTFGQAVRLTASLTFTPSQVAAVPTGTVTFRDNSTVLGNVPLGSDNTAYLELSNLTAGSHTLTAQYDGNSLFSPANSSPMTLTVNPLPTSLALDSWPNAALSEQPVTFTVVVRGTPGGSVVPSGTVSLSEGSNLVANLPLDGAGTATYVTNTLALGSHQFVAQYAGNSNVLGSTSPTLTQQIVDVCSGQVVNSREDDGSATQCGTLSYALKQYSLQPANSPTFTIGFNVPQVVVSSTVTLTTNTQGVPLVVNGGCAVQGGRGVPQLQLVPAAGTTITNAVAISSNITIAGVKIGGFDGYGVEIAGSHNTLLCNWLGTTDGIAASPNSAGGVHLVGANNQLGLPDQPQTGNLISGNGGAGLTIEASSNNDKLYYTWVGFQADGSDPLKNLVGAIKFMSGAHTTTLGSGNRFNLK